MRNKHVRESRVFRQPKHSVDQPELLPPTLEELVPTGHVVRSLKAIIDHLDLSAAEELYEDKGGYAYDPRAMLAVLLYALIDGERSSRRIQEHCRFDVRYRYLCGAHAPDDRTICRFRRRLEPVLPGIFAQVLTLARGRGMVKGNVVAVDGTRVAGNVQQWRKILSEAENEDCADPDCRTIQTRRGYINGYNAQAAVDAETGVVLAASVSNSAADYKQLPKMVDSVQEALGEGPASVVADKGYESSENAAMLESRAIDSYLVPRGGEAEFWDLDEAGRIVCPEGHALRHHGRFQRRGVKSLKLYIRECAACPKRAGCHGAKYKVLSHPEGVDPAARIRNAKRCRSPEGRRILRMRSSGIETVFGQMKWNKGLRRFRLRGLNAVGAEFILECLAHNLQKVLKDLLQLLFGCFHASSPCRASYLSPAM